jgi:hypothetical protein
MSSDTLAWVIRSVMVVAAAVATFLLTQTEVVFDPWVNLLLGEILVALAALNPTTISSRVLPNG